MTERECLEWLHRKGGLGLDVHARIEKVLNATRMQGADDVQVVIAGLNALLHDAQDEIARLTTTQPAADADDAQPVAIKFSEYEAFNEAARQVDEQARPFREMMGLAIRDAAPKADVPSFDAKHVSLKQKGDKVILTLELDGVEGSPRYTVTPINPGVVRVAASAPRDK